MKTRGTSNPQLVDFRLEKLEGEVHDFGSKLDQLVAKTSVLHESITVLKMKMALIGGLAGTIASAVTTAIANHYIRP